MPNPKDLKQRDDRSRMPVQSPGSGESHSEPGRDDRSRDEQSKRDRRNEPGQRQSGEEEE